MLCNLIETLITLEPHTLTYMTLKLTATHTHTHTHTHTPTHTHTQPQRHTHAHTHTHTHSDVHRRRGKKMSLQESAIYSAIRLSRGALEETAGVCWSCFNAPSVK